MVGTSKQAAQHHTGLHASMHACITEADDA